MKNPTRQRQSRKWTNFCAITSFAQLMVRANSKSHARNLRNHPDDPDQLIYHASHGEVQEAMELELQESIS